MDKEKVIIFDFDGTIANTLYTLLEGYNKRVAPVLKCKPVDLEKIDEYKKWTARDLLKEHRINALKLPVVIFWLRRYLKRQIHTVEHFEAVDAVIKELYKKGYSLGILTSNTTKNVKAFLERNDLDEYFKYIYSSKKFSGKAKVYMKMAEKHDLNDKEVIYVGDEVRDIKFVKKIGIPIICVSWGLTDPEVLRQEEPDYLIDHPEEIIPIIHRETVPKH